MPLSRSAHYLKLFDGAVLASPSLGMHVCMTQRGKPDLHLPSQDRRVHMMLRGCTLVKRQHFTHKCMGSKAAALHMGLHPPGVDAVLWGMRF